MNTKDILISFDTTSSMFPCLSQVRNNVEQLVTKLFKEIPDVRIGIIAHGDYCDENVTYLSKMLDFSEDVNKICHFVKNVDRTFGGDAEEAYEWVLNQARTASWKSGTSKSLIMIGDDLPHSTSYKMNFKKLDWKNEAKLLSEAGIKIYSVQALGRSYANHFWKELANISSGYHLSLNQFSDIQNLIMAVGYKQVSDDQLLDYERELIINGQMNRSMDGIISSMLNRKTSVKYDTKTFSDTEIGELKPVSSGRFQVMDVDTDVAIKDFVVSNGIEFKVGRGFYQFTKRVKVQDHKEIILMNKLTGNFFTGNAARKLAGIPLGVTANVSPESLPEYLVFIQSTSANRKLIGGTKFLYEIPDWED